MDYPFLDPSFEVPWSRLDAASVEPDITEALRRARKRVDAVKAQKPEKATFASAFLALEEATEELDRAWSYVSNLDSVCNSPELRAAYNKMLPAVTAFHTKLPLDSGLWQVLKAAANSESGDKLTGPERRLVEETVAAFVRSGADLDAAGKARIAEIESELAAKTQKFSENELDSTHAYELLVDDPLRLAGLPESARETALESARKKGHGSPREPVYRFTLQMPSLLPAMKYLEDGELRRRLWEASIGVGAKDPHDNTALIRDILRLRAEKARLLGFPHFPDLVLERRMAKNGPAALEFVEDLYRKTKPAFDAENAELEAFRSDKTGESGPLAPWEQAFWAERLRRERFDLDEEEVRPYFPVGHVLDGLFAITEQVFGVRVTECVGERKPDVWHPDVRFYDVTDSATGERLGAFYADWFPRESKRGGAWMHGLIDGERGPDRKRTPHLGLMAGNMSPPLGDAPALLTHNEVETVFHEFGHLLHHLLGEVPLKALNGTNVAWDWVELPSQIMENWCWEKQALDLFARHYKTGEHLPEPLFAKMLEARNFHAARAQMRQLSFARLDLELHLRPERFLEGDLDAELLRLLEGYTVPTSVPQRPIVRRFSHLFGSPTGYAAGYYSYKWAEVLDADAFSRFASEGILNPAVGLEFRHHVLSQGNAEDPAVLYRRFMGRDPDPEALLRRLGLRTPA